MSSVTEADDRMTIGVFARATGISASALRFYDDCGLVTPSVVEAGSGYRYYEQRQVRTVVAIRHLRRLGLSLSDVRRLLSAPSAVVQDVVAGRLRQLELDLLQARRSADRAMALLHDPARTTLPGPSLAEAIGQVSSAVDGHAEGPAVLAGVLLETAGDELRLVATDRFRLVSRCFPSTADDSRYRVVVSGEALQQLTGWLAEQEAVHLSVDDDQVWWAGVDDQRTLPVLGRDYPDYRLVLDALPEPTTRVIADRQHLLAGSDGDETIDWRLDPTGGLTVVRAGQRTRVAAEVQGTTLDIGFDPVRLRAALAVSAGPDLMLDLTTPDRPVVVRSADDGDLTTVLMPVRREIRGAA